MSGKRKANMAECAQAIAIENEEFWGKWKENKCVIFEKPSSKLIEARKRDVKKLGKISGLCANLVRPKQGEVNDPKNGKEMVQFLSYPKE